MDSAALPATWQEALENHSLTNVKAFEKQLRGSALRDKEKLRALVGSNYRELLLTAEQIVELDKWNRQAEVGISALGQACRIPDELNIASIPSKAAVSASQIKLVDRLLRCASRATKDGSVLLASRLITIARLMVKHLEQDYGSSKTGQWLTLRLKNGRQQLMNYIDSMLVRPTTSLNQLVQAAGAYCLTTSSSSADVTRHFRILRLQRLTQGLTAENPSKSLLNSDLKQRCHYFSASVTAIKTLSGRGVVDLLNSLQKHPILEDRDLLAIETLQLDAVKNLLPADILTFTPYFKRAASLSAEIRTSLQQWVEEASKQLSKHIEMTIQDKSLKYAFRMRQNVFDILLPSCFSTLSHGIIATSIRKIFSDRITDLIQQQARLLESLGAEIKSILGSTKPSEKPLWQSDIPRKVTAQPPSACLREIRISHLGVTNNLATYLDKLRRWLLAFDQIEQHIDTLAKVRWQDKIEEYDEEDEEDAHNLISSLSKTDPADYLQTHSEAANKAADFFIAQIEDLTSHITQPADGDIDSSLPISHVPILLRITREILHIFASLLPNKDLSQLHTITKLLHTTLADSTATILFDRLAAQQVLPSTSTLTFAPPDLPSPSAICVLKTLCTHMIEIGGIDIWTTPATTKLKTTVLERLLDGDKDVRDRYVKSDMDEAYLRVALGKNGNGDQNGKTDDHAEKDADVRRRATMLWNRSRLLFGVLCG